MSRKLRIYSLLPLLALTACGSDDPDLVAPDTYDFDSRFLEGEDTSSVSYTGQTLRHVLIDDMKTYIGGLDARIEEEASFDATTVEDALLSYYLFDSDTNGTNEILLSTDPSREELTYDEISSGKNLAEKIAGQDSGGAKDHKDWSTEFKGWSDTSVEAAGGDISNPDGLVRAFMATVGANAVAQSNQDESRANLKVYQTASGQDLQQLIQKFLLGAVTFSQGADDYLDEGLAADNSAAEEGKGYTALEHAWDEGFGYFGAARDYLQQSDADIADGKQSDADGNGKISLISEYNFGASVNAAKRDNGSTTGTDFTADAMKAFLQGRHLISTEADPALIEAEAEKATLAWEKAIAATVVHYINDTTADQEALGTDAYSFDDHAKHWSELKGFALGLQFNPRSPLSDADFEKFHSLIGDAPVLADASEEAQKEYLVALGEARDLIAAAYDFASEDAEGW